MGMYRFSFIAGLAAGYVLGARAGRERYDQIMQAARTFAQNPTVQQAAGAAQAQVTGLAATAGSKISDKVPGLRHDGHETNGSGTYASAGQGSKGGQRRQRGQEDN